MPEVKPSSFIISMSYSVRCCSRWASSSLPRSLNQASRSCQLALDLDQALLHRLVLGHVVARRPDRDVVDVVEDLARQRVEVVDRLDLVAEEVQPVGRLRIGREDLHQLALRAERAAGERRLVAVVLHADELLEELVAVDPLPHLEELHLLRVELGRADAVDARDGGDDHDVAPGEERRRRRVAQAVDLVVDGRVLLDVEVLRRDIRLGLVVVVVGDEVLDRVLGEELAELVAELRGERLVVSDHQGRPLDALDRRGHRERLAGPGGAREASCTSRPRRSPRRAPRSPSADPPWACRRDSA